MNVISPFAERRKIENILFPKNLEVDNLFPSAPVQVFALQKLYCHLTPTISLAAHDTALGRKLLEKAKTI